MPRVEDSELRICRRYGCRHQARDHGFIDGKPACYRCGMERRMHPFQAASDEKRRKS